MGVRTMSPRDPKPDAGRPGASSRRPVPLGRSLSRQGAERTAARPAGPSGEAADPPGILPAEGGPAAVEALRRAVARMEGRADPRGRLGAGGEAEGSVSGLRLDVPAFDGLFPAGLPLAALVETRAAETRQAGPLTGFVAALAARIGMRRRGPVLWVREGRVHRETGAAAGLGLLHLGLDPARLLVVAARDAAEALWAMEEGLACPGLAAVVGEMHGLPRAFDLTASRRLALRAREGGVPALLAGHAMPEAASAAAVRLAVTPRPSRPAGGFEGGPGFPAWTVAVEKNRDGRTGRVDLEWNSDDRAFRPLDPLPVALAADAADRPARPPQPGALLAHPAVLRRVS